MYIYITDYCCQSLVATYFHATKAKTFFRKIVTVKCSYLFRLSGIA